MSAALVAPDLPAARRDVWRHRAIVANLVAQIGIVVTGGAVRLTASGLGCSTWPMCEPGAFTPVRHAAATGHSFIEFGNRTLTGVLGVIALAVAYLVWTNRSRGDAYRKLGLAPLIGVALQALVGGVTVLLDLHPAVVAVHMLISLALISVSTLLLRREREGDGPAHTVVGPAMVRAGWLLAGVAVVLLSLGVIVTGAGPHGGDDDVAYRFAVDPALMSRLHALAVWVFCGVLAVMLVALWRTGAPAAVRRSGILLVAVTLAQGLVGYVQYFTGLPALLVGVHMLGAGLLAAALTWFLVSLRTRAQATLPDTAGDDAGRVGSPAVA
ncbi:COX15/CtaA family protein [Cellulomonas cellasea]|uniref:COX15/CtaA family protein n=1 Tax=Cellulomonas cellasea TaxID=43670 RepID=UPI0025A387C1|nr:COX15/CtaA family protein [Cellulomonas cellasea]MDM8085967.1 COX15/CtaA family protein [Cellulomonas cellasea]